MTTQDIETENTIFKKSGGKLLTVNLDNKEYGIPILQAREVVSMQNVYPIPRTPSFMKGAINLRGRIIPIIDLRIKFELTEQEVNKETCIVVVNINDNTHGIIVDQLNGVITIKEEEYEDSPNFGNNINANFVAGIVKLANRVIIVLELESILDNSELTNISELLESTIPMTEESNAIQTEIVESKEGE